MAFSESQWQRFKDFMAQHPEPIRPDQPDTQIITSDAIPHKRGTVKVAFLDRFDESEWKYRVEIGSDGTSHTVLMTPDAIRRLTDALNVLIEHEAKARAVYAQYAEALAVFHQQRAEWERDYRPALDALVAEFDAEDLENRGYWYPQPLRPHIRPTP